MTALRIAIVGAGVGGLAAALALSGRGDEITILERRTGFGETGAGIQLSPNASRILIRFGLGSVLGRAASEPDRILVRSLRSGREIGAVVLGRAAIERFGAPYWFIARSDLHTALLDAARSRGDIRLRVGRSLAGLTQNAAGVSLICDLANGQRDYVEADLVIGADGLWSRTRACLGDNRAPVYSGYSAHRATVPRNLLPDALRGPEGGLWLGSGRHVVHYPIGSGALVNIVAVARRPRQFEGWTSAPDTVAEGFAPAGAAPALRELLGRIDDWSAWSLFDLPVRSMMQGRVALLGDAAHPALPFLAQGGAMAIEDAAILAGEIGRGRDRLPEALASYQRHRLSRTRRVQTEARRNARIYHAGGLIAAARNAVMRRQPADGMLERYAWLYGWRPDGA